MNTNKTNLDEDKALEDAAERHANKYYDKNSEEESINWINRKFNFLDGAKSPEAKAYHTKGMYTEEDMKLAFETGRNFQLTGENNFSELLKSIKP